MDRRIVTWLASLMAGCFHPEPANGVPCSSSGDCPAGQTCDLLTQVCGGPTSVQVWRDDTAEDFSRPGAVVDEVTVEPGGFVGPAAYIVDGVRLRGIATNALATTPGIGWDQLAAMPITGSGLERSLDLNYEDLVPWGVGLTISDDITILFEAEVNLDVAGAWRFELTANDLGFVEIAAPGSDAFVRLLDDVDTGTQATFPVATPGWHRIRGAFADSNQFLELKVRLATPTGSFRTLAGDRLRARADDLTGTFTDAFDDSFMIAPRGALWLDAISASALGGDPYGIPIGMGTWTLRWSAQVLIDVEGDYGFRIDSVSGHRAWIGAVELADTLDIGAGVTATVPVHLAPGWHDLVVDLQRNNNSSPSSLALTVATGPTWVGGEIPADHLRPIIGRSVRWTGARNSSTLAIPDMGTASRGLSVDYPTNATALKIHAKFTLNHPVLPSVSVVLDPPTGSNVTMAAAGSLSGAGAASDTDVVSTSRAGSSWNFLMTDDTLDVMTGTLESAAVTIVYGGAGAAPFEARYRYVSAARDLGEVAGYGAVTWGLRQATAATTVVVTIRTCDDAAGCELEPWTEVGDGATPTVPVRRFAQYAVELTGDGDTPTALDWIELAYLKFD